MPTVMALSGSDDEKKPRCKRVKTKTGTRRKCPVERENGKWRWAFESKTRRSRR